MDTIELNVYDPSLSDLVRKNLYDGQGGFKEPDLVSNRRRGYKHQTHSTSNGKSIFLACDRWNDLYPSAIIQLHASQFNTLEECTNWLSPLFGNRENEIPDLALRRLDLCIDVNVPQDTVRQCIRRPYARFMREYVSTGVSNYYGKPPLEIVIYSKTFPVSTVDYSPAELSSSGNEIVHGTRIEARFTGVKRPIHTLREVNRLREFNPFSKLQTISLDEALIAEAPLQTKYMIESYLRKCEMDGAHAAIREFNQDRNFFARIRPYLGPVKLDLEAGWKNRINRFLG